MSQYKRTILLTLGLLLVFPGKVVIAQSCTQDLPMPPGSQDDRDTSGLRPSRQPPILVDDFLYYQCPALKQIKGKSSFKVRCNDLQQYVFPSELSSWGECECMGDLTAQCPGLTYKMGYVYSSADKPSMTLTIPQAEGTTGWELDLTMDSNVQAMHIRSSHASLVVTSSNSVHLEPLGSHSFKDSSADVRLDFYFDNKTDWEANNQGEIPRWRFPCVATVKCKYTDDKEVSRALIWTLVGVIVGVFIFLVLCCVCCAFCCKKSTNKVARMLNSASSDGKSVATIDGMHPEFYYQEQDVRRRTPQLEDL